MDFKIAVAVPCYNEEMTIEKVIGTSELACPRLRYTYLIIIRATEQQKSPRKRGQL